MFATNKINVLVLYLHLLLLLVDIGNQRQPRFIKRPSGPRDAADRAAAFHRSIVPSSGDVESLQDSLDERSVIERVTLSDWSTSPLGC